MSLEYDTLLRTRAKRSSSEALLKRSAPDADRNGIWIDRAKIFPRLISDLLNRGHKVKFRAPGYSMYPTLLHDDVITVEPVKPGAIRVGDIILYQDQESLIAHRVVQIENKSDSRSSVLSLPRRSHTSIVTKTGTQSCFTLRGDARPACDSPIAAEQILGKVILIESHGRRIDPYGLKVKLTSIARRFVFRLKRFLNPV